MGYGGIGEEPLDIPLKKGEQVPRGHGRDGDDREDEEESGVVPEAHVGEIAQEKGKDGAFGNRGDESGHRGGRAS